MNQSQIFRAQKNQLLLELGSLAQLSSLRQAHSTLTRLAHLTDETLTSLWLECGLSDPLALIAVGGFGRGELFPYSDVDVLVLLPESSQIPKELTNQETLSRVERFIGMCWDCGLEIGSSVRTLSECLQESKADITVQTALLESRLITGNAGLFNEFRQGFLSNLDVKGFFVAKTLEMRQRHNKFDNTPYALEPNCKESPGGLRDLQVLLWLSKAAGFGASWQDLKKMAWPHPWKRKSSNAMNPY